MQASPKNQALIDAALKLTKKFTVGLVNPISGESLEGALFAHDEGLIEPILIGPIDDMRCAAKSLGKNLDDYNYIAATDAEDAADIAIGLAKDKKINALMKGDIHTSKLMKKVVAKDGLRTGRRISHCMVIDIPTYEKTAIFSDAAINIYPDLETKKHIIENAIDMAHALNIEKPQIAVLAAVETVMESNQATVDAGNLKQMAQEGQFKNCLLDGPLSIDLAVSKKAAMAKHFTPTLTEQPDVFIAPDLNSANILVKTLDYLANGQSAGIVLGAQVPIIMMSRSSAAIKHLLSCALAKLYAGYHNT